MDNKTAFIDYLGDFTFEVFLPVYQEITDTPIYNKSKLTWEINSTLKTPNYTLSKGKNEGIQGGHYINPVYFHMYDVFHAGPIKWKQMYKEHLLKLYETFISELNTYKSNHNTNEYYQLIKDYKTRLEKITKHIKKNQVCYNPEMDFDNYSEEYFSHEEVKINYYNDFNNESSRERGLLNYLIAKMVSDQILIINNTIEYLENEIKSFTGELVPEILHEDITDMESAEESFSNDSAEKEFKRIRFLKNVNILGTLFYDLLNKKYIDTSKTNIEKFLHDSFSDEHGNAIKKSTINTILKPEREDKRANENDRIKVPDQ
jgi:hypothetical protein